MDPGVEFAGRAREFWGVVFALLLLATGASAQVIDAWDYPTVQDAIDAAPDGAVVVGGVSTGVVIRRPITLLGTVFDRDIDPSSGPWREFIGLGGAGRGEVVLAHIQIPRFYVSGCCRSEVGPAVSGGGFEALRIYDSTIHATQLSAYDGRAFGVQGVNVGVPYLVIERSVISGSSTDDAYPAGAAPSGDAVLAPRSTAVLLDSVITGGSGGVFGFESDGCWPWMYDQARGGHGVVARRVITSGCQIIGGDCGEIFYSHRLGLPPEKQCPPGAPAAPIDAGARVIELSEELVLLDEVQRGSTFRIAYTGNDTALLLAARKWRTPLSFGETGLLFLGDGRWSTGVILPGGIRSFSVPPAYALTGQEIAFQAFSPASGLTRPVTGVIR
ncbi:MAG: hypothetical protein ABL998_00585 [Planctomycetota bacterium]